MVEKAPEGMVKMIAKAPGLTVGSYTDPETGEQKGGFVEPGEIYYASPTDAQVHSKAKWADFAGIAGHDEVRRLVAQVADPTDPKSGSGQVENQGGDGEPVSPGPDAPDASEKPVEEMTNDEMKDELKSLGATGYSQMNQAALQAELREARSRATQDDSGTLKPDELDSVAGQHGLDATPPQSDADVESASQEDSGS